MAKVSFTKLGLKANQDIKNINFNEQTIEVKQYLPIDDKLKLISNVINNSLEQDRDFANPVKVKVFTDLEVLYNYTNINFTEKQKEDPAKLYDLVYSSGLIAAVLKEISEFEYNEVFFGVTKSLESYYKYTNSAVGLLENIKREYSDMNLDASAIQQKLADPDNMQLLKDILAKLG